jgi:hypothetical protein
MKFKAALILLTLFVSGSSLAAYADPIPTNINPGRVGIDPLMPAYYSLGVCEDSEQLDCIYSVQVKGESGPFLESEELGTQSWIEEEDEFGNTLYKSSTDWTVNTQWTIPQLNGETFGVDASVHTPTFLGPDGANRGRLDVGAAGLPRGYSVKVAVRTSWIKAQNLQFISDESSYTQEPIAGVAGAYLWTFTGTHARVASYELEEKWEKTMQDPMDWSEAADVDHYWLDFIIHHAGDSPETSWWDPRCSDYGFTAQAFNSNAAGSPEWNYETGSLEFNIFAPHYDSSGVTVNQGFFRLWIHEEFAECQWPDNTLVGAEALEVLILNEDGSEQSANTFITNEGGMIYLEAIDFHYSVPTFIIRPRSDTSNVDNPSTGQQVSRASAPTLATTPEVLEETPNPKLSKSAESEKLNPNVAASAAKTPDSDNSGILALMAIVALVISNVVTLEILRRSRAMPLGRRRV